MAKIWEELSGQTDNWEALLSAEHLDDSFRRYLIHYGDVGGAAGMGFNSNKYSPSIGNPLYKKDTLFKNLGLALGNPNTYNVTEYIYGYYTKNNVSNMIGYVAVTSDASVEVSRRRDIIVCFRGNMRDFEIEMDVTVGLVPSPDMFPDQQDVKVHQGWSEYYTSKEPKENSTSAREQVVTEIKRLINLYKEEEISITVVGHSMGAAIATLSAMDIVYNGVNTYSTGDKKIPVTVFGFAGPKVGGRDGAFTQVYEDLMKNKRLRILRITNSLDVVQNLPDVIFYVHVGQELKVDHTKSPFLKSDFIANAKLTHQLEVYLHTIAGPYKDQNGEPKLRVERQLTLLNRGLDALKDTSIAPANWWVDKFKGFVQEDDGTWVMCA